MGYCLPGIAVGQVDQLEDRYLGMVEASGSNPDLSITLFWGSILRSGSWQSVQAENISKPRIKTKNDIEESGCMINEAGG